MASTFFFSPPTLLLTLLLVLLCLQPFRPTATSPDPPPHYNTDQSACLAVAPSEFAASLRSAVDAITGATAVVSGFLNSFGTNFRVSSALSDCLDLLDFSAQELGWTLSATQNPNVKGVGTGALSSDLRTWLGAALGNQDTCIDGFEGSNGFVRGSVTSSVTPISSLIHNVLAMVHPSSDQFYNHDDNTNNDHAHAFPSWMKPKDRKLIQQQQQGSDGGGLLVDATVAQDGTGNYTSVMDAVLAAPNNSTRRYVIHIKKGVYHENVEIKKKKWNIMMIGDGMDQTIISGNRSVVDGWTTFRSATFAVSGKGFIARDMTFENTAGPQKHQAVALRCDSDLSAFYRCGMRGYQDTLYAHSLRQFYRECTITGTVDFIFGNAAAVFQKCLILAREGLPNQKNTVTAQGRKEALQTTGFALQFCNISSEYKAATSNNSTNTTTTTITAYLGRPWKEYSRTVIMQSYIDAAIRPEGWLEWNGNFALDTLYYAEYMNFGPASGLAPRVKWPGFHSLDNSTMPTNFTVAQFIEGNMWLPSTGVTFSAGLSV